MSTISSQQHRMKLSIWGPPCKTQCLTQPANMLPWHPRSPTLRLEHYIGRGSDKTIYQQVWLSTNLGLPARLCAPECAFPQLRAGLQQDMCVVIQDGKPVMHLSLPPSSASLRSPRMFGSVADRHRWLCSECVTATPPRLDPTQNCTAGQRSK